MSVAALVTGLLLTAYSVLILFLTGRRSTGLSTIQLRSARLHAAMWTLFAAALVFSAFDAYLLSGVLGFVAVAVAIVRVVVAVRGPAGKRLSRRTSRSSLDQSR